ncbi:MAG: FCD domain-containing protein [Alphaproteobacteria bacterium]|nr:FCD domain-containing protein [Alphaproteobacteria bacterium]
MSVGGIADPPEKTLAERIYNQLRRDILVGSLEPGRKLRFEYLRERYEAGMSTFRESLARLAADGLVIAEGQRGFRVAAVSLADLWDVTRLRQKMETLALQRAIEIGDDGWEAEIVAAYHRLSKLKDPRSGRLTLLGEEPLLRHRAFHFSLIAACDSPWTMRFVSTLYDHSERYRRFSTLRASAPRDTDGEHQALMQAALGRDAKTATRLLVDHLEQTARVVTSLSASWDPAGR